MCNQFEIGGVKYFVTRDFEEMLIVNFLLNPEKINIFVKPIGLLVPCGVKKFSPIVTTEEGGILTFLGHRFKYKSFDVPCTGTRVFKVDLFGMGIFNFHTDKGTCLEKLMAVRQ